MSAGQQFAVMYFCSQRTQLTKRYSKLATETLGKGVTSKTSKHQKKSDSLFAGNNCLETCPRQLFLEDAPIYVQKSAFNFYV